jgi:hypothetical protein
MSTLQLYYRKAVDLSVRRIAPPPYAIAMAIGLVVAAISIILHFLPGILNTTPDTAGYTLLAQNMVSNFCYSFSPVETHQCVATWALEPPGYPIFLLIIGLFFGDGLRPIVIGQMLLFSCAAIYFNAALYKWHKSNLAFVLGVAVSLFSPAPFGWSHFILTEYLSAAAVLFVFTELVRSIQEKHIRTIPICIAVICGMLLRWDLFFLLVPVFVTLSICFGIRATFIRQMTIAAVCGLPYFLFMVRAAAVGLPLLPTPFFNARELPPGPMQFYQAAALDERATQHFAWPFMGKQYGKVQLKAGQDCNKTTPAPEYARTANAAEICSLFKQLNQVPDAKPIPPSLDKGFSDLAERVPGNWGIGYVEIPPTRAVRMWSIWFGHGLPSLHTGLSSITKSIFRLYYLAVFIGLLIALRISTLQAIAIGALGFMIVRTAFLVSPPISALEVRYLDLFFPSVDAIALSGYVLIIARLRGAGSAPIRR